MNVPSLRTWYIQNGTNPSIRHCMICLFQRVGRIPNRPQTCAAAVSSILLYDPLTAVAQTCVVVARLGPACWQPHQTGPLTFFLAVTSKHSSTNRDREPNSRAEKKRIQKQIQQPNQTQPPVSSYCCLCVRVSDGYFFFVRCIYV